MFSKIEKSIAFSINLNIILYFYILNIYLTQGFCFYLAKSLRYFCRKCIISTVKLVAPIIIYISGEKNYEVFKTVSDNTDYFLFRRSVEISASLADTSEHIRNGHIIYGPSHGTYSP